MRSFLYCMAMAMAIAAGAYADGFNSTAALPYEYNNAAIKPIKLKVCPAGQILKSDSAGRLDCSDLLAKFQACQDKGLFYAPGTAGADADGCVGFQLDADNNVTLYQ